MHKRLIAAGLMTLSFILVFWVANFTIAAPLYSSLGANTSPAFDTTYNTHPDGPYYFSQFEVPDGAEWTIRRVSLHTTVTFSQGSDPNEWDSPPETYTIRFAFNDPLTNLPQDDYACNVDGTHRQILSFGDFQHHIDLDEACLLTGGTYWLSAASTITAAPFGTWGAYEKPSRRIAVLDGDAWSVIDGHDLAYVLHDTVFPSIEPGMGTPMPGAVLNFGYVPVGEQA
jgi:hypothetical protein